LTITLIAYSILITLCWCAAWWAYKRELRNARTVIAVQGETLRRQGFIIENLEHKLAVRELVDKREYWPEIIGEK
jgi:hypothetical protein